MLWDAHRVPPPWPIICVPMRAGVHWLMRSVSAFAAPLPPVVCFVCPDKKRCLWKGYLSAIAYLHIAAYSLLRPRVVTTDNDRRRLARTQCIVAGWLRGVDRIKSTFVCLHRPSRKYCSNGRIRTVLRFIAGAWWFIFVVFYELPVLWQICKSWCFWSKFRP